MRHISSNHTFTIELTDEEVKVIVRALGYYEWNEHRTENINSIYKFFRSLTEATSL